MMEQVIAGMLPKNKLGKQMYRKLKVYAGDKHPHQAQQPVAMELGPGLEGLGTHSRGSVSTRSI